MKYVIVIMTAVLAFFESNAQDHWSFQNLINVGTIPPEAASLGRFGSVPVSHFTGIPSITVPVYEIAAGKLRLPISLDYHAGGVRVDELSSSVGTGWALNGIGIITRSMIGTPDMPGSTGHNYISSPDAQDVLAAPSNYDTFIMEVWNKSSDTEPDIFQYNVNGLSGRFIFRNDGSILQIPLTNNKITYASGNFTITDPQGNIYIFEEKRQSYSNGVHDPTYVSTWCVTKAVDANSTDTIAFSYETTLLSTISHFVNTTASWGVSMTTDACTGGPGETAVCSGSSGELQFSFDLVTDQGYYPTEIKWRGGKVVFTNVNDRTDDTGTALRLDRVDVYSKLNGAYNLIKKTKLYQSYFFSNHGSDVEKKYRLRLDSVGNLDPSTSAGVQLYRMTYNNTPIAPRESFAQDRWGFTNGEYANTGQMPYQTINYVGAYHDFGNANRDTNETQILAGTLTSIEYPTKGKTVVEMEPHQYHTNLPVTDLKSFSSILCCGTNSSSQQYFTPNNNSNNFRYRGFISRFNYPDVTDRPRIKMYDETAGGALVVQVSNSGPDVSQNYVTGVIAVDLVQGHTYRIDIDLFTTNVNVSATLDIWWDEIDPEASDIEKGGGLRVKSLTNYDATGEFIGKEMYDYGDDGTGIMITAQYYQNINYENTIHRIGYMPCSGSGFCLGETAEGNCSPIHAYMTTYHASSILPISQFSGTPVVYKKVTQRSIDRNGNDNGKTVYTFNVVNDSSEPIPHTNVSGTSELGVALVSNVWQNGMLLEKQVYKTTPSGYQLISEAINDYDPSLLTSQEVLRPRHKYTQLGDCLITTYLDFLLPVVPINSGSMLLQSTTTTSWDDAGTSSVSVEGFTYGSGSLLPSSIANTSSAGETLTENFTYPVDLAAPGNVYKKMDDRNMKEIVVRDQKMINGSQVSLMNINYYDWLGNSKLLMPISVSEQVGTNPEEVRIQYNDYDTYGNILRQQKANDYLHSYLWDYSTNYPIAEVINADNSSIAYTSFEAEGSGNWTVSSSNRDATKAMTGSRSYVITGSNTVSKSSGVTVAQTYIVSYWKRGGVAGSFTVSGTTQTTTGETINSWTYYEHIVTGVTTLSITGSGNIDELRLYPKDSQLTTYTYTPLIGLTSSTDPKNMITYYEYDTFGRLKWMKDAYGNIVKAFEYHYRSK